MKIKTKIKKILTWGDKKLPQAKFYSFIMSDNEKKLFEKTIKFSKIYLEFGMGGSTFKVLQKSDAKVFSIDSSTEWISSMQEYKQIRRMEEKGRLLLFHVDIGSTREWGKPVDNSQKEKFPNYSSQIFNSIETKDIDTVLIDGRFRVACALKTIVELYKNKNLQIIIHDFFNRKEYHCLLNYLDVVKKADSLGVFKVKNNIVLDDILMEYEKYKYIPD